MNRRWLRMMHITRWSYALIWLLPLGLSVPLTVAHSAEWPEGYNVQENSESPDGRYGVVIPGRDTVSEDDTSVNYLGDLKSHQVLGKIRESDYFEGQNHRGLRAQWAPDSTWCVLLYDGRYGFDNMFVLEPKGSSFTQTDRGERVHKSINALVAKQAHNSEEGGDASAYLRTGPDRKVRVRALAVTNPKQFDNVKTYYGLFQGTYDLNARRWTVTDARPLKAEEDDALQSAYEQYTSEGITFASDEDKAKSLDEQMNEVYDAARLILTPVRFAKVKQEQIDWLKKRDATSSIAEKCSLMEARIKALQDLVW